MYIRGENGCTMVVADDGFGNLLEMNKEEVLAWLGCCRAFPSP